MSKPNRVWIVETRNEDYDWSPEPGWWWTHHAACERRRDVMANGWAKNDVRVVGYRAVLRIGGEGETKR